MGFLSKLQARKELNRLEDRYVKRTDRNIWRSNAKYVNGEYVFTCREEVQPPTSRSVQQKPAGNLSRGSSSSRPSTHSSTASKNSSTNGAAKRFSTTFWGNVR